jgi:hypothetical protein
LRRIKGEITTVLSAITATTTSAEVNCTGFNSLLVECDVTDIVSGNWAVDVQGTMVSGTAVGDCYDMLAGSTPVKMSTGTISANGKRLFIFRGIPDFIKIKATRTTDGTITCKVQPVNL